MKEKLVRDNIPKLMLEAGIQPRYRYAKKEERLGLLLEKLHEEASELNNAPCIEECADVLEVLFAIAEELQATKVDLIEVASKKMNIRGGFGKAIVLEI